MTRRKILIAALAASTACAAARPAAAARFSAIERIAGATPVTVLVGDKPRIYFRLVSTAPLKFPVDGPARVRVVSRVECRSAGVVTYRLLATEGAKVLDQLDTESSASSEVRLEKGSTPLGKSRRLTFEVPEGRHEVSLALTGANAALVRIRTSPSRTAEAMVSLTPVNADRSVSVVEGEKLIPYYTVVGGRPVKLRIIGPTSLELSSRHDFDATMRGVQGYRLRLVEDGRTLRELDLKTTKAVTAAYQNVRDRVPSKITITRVSVPKGTHEITIELVAPPRSTAQIHARIPEPSVGNEE
ncbi:MAG: hypothetical protein ABIS67_10295 [Candidatus Eisenbacteria bacterium]